jgi:hypothetical protein
MLGVGAGIHPELCLNMAAGVRGACARVGFLRQSIPASYNRLAGAAAKLSNRTRPGSCQGEDKCGPS